ncbi:hypothetical protein C0991_008996 [Blastosporella zonata]|nr:hypothetical protein C0991_008996 [Blastosporella zonata]
MYDQGLPLYPNMGFKYKRGLDYRPVIPREFERPSPVSRRMNSRSQAVQSQAPALWPRSPELAPKTHAPVIPQLEEREPHAQEHPPSINVERHQRLSPQARHPATENPHQETDAEHDYENRGADNSSARDAVAPPASGPGRRSRAPTPFHLPRSIEPSIDERSPALSDLSGLPPAIPTITSPRHLNETLPPGPTRDSLRSPQQPVSSPNTATNSPATPTTSPTTPASHTSSRPSYTYQPEPNPLPLPPVDIFTLPQYQNLWNRIQSRQLPAQGNSDVNLNLPSEVPKQKKGFFRMFSLKKAATPPLKSSVRFMVIEEQPPSQLPQSASHVSAQLSPHSTVLTNQPQTTQVMHTPGSVSHYNHAAPAATAGSLSQETAHIAVASSQEPSPAMPLPNLGSGSNEPTSTSSNHLPSQQTTAHVGAPVHHPQRIIFDENSDRSYYFMHSPHPIFYEDETYPTAAHLLEALKFLPGHPAIAKRIRLTQDLQQAQQISAENQALEDPTFAVNLAENTFKVIGLKFRQHANLRYKLCELDMDAQILYNNPDSFWGVGTDGKGNNALGKLLGRVLRELKPKRPQPPKR